MERIIVEQARILLNEVENYERDIDTTKTLIGNNMLRFEQTKIIHITVDEIRNMIVQMLEDKLKLAEYKLKQLKE